MTLTLAPHPLLDAAAFAVSWPSPLGELPSPEALTQHLSLTADAPMRSSDQVRAAVRDLLRHGGFKPTGRSKPASEYLLRAAGDGTLGPINLAVDLCNVVSLHSGLPISVVDLDLAQAPLSIQLPAEGTSYVFNPSGQVIDVGGLVSLFDGAGPCAGPVKDSQRTKTHPGTRRSLCVVWGTRALPGWTQATTRWYRDLTRLHGGLITDVDITA